MGRFRMKKMKRFFGADGGGKLKWANKVGHLTRWVRGTY